MSTQWRHLGVQLKMSIGTLDRIRTQFTDPRDQLLEMLKTWLNNSHNTSWKTLADALRSRSVEKSRLADDLERKYCLVPEGTKEDRVVSSPESDPENYVTPPSEPDDRDVSVSKPMIDLPASQPQMADMQNLESKLLH